MNSSESSRQRSAATKVETPQTRPDLARMAYRNLCAWIMSQEVPITSGQREKQNIQALAERTWDAKESGTSDNLRKDLTQKIQNNPSQSRSRLLKPAHILSG